MKTIALLQRKGGVGRTTIASFIATALAMLGYKVLAIDTDSQANLTTGLGIGVLPGVKKLFEGHSWQNLIQRVPNDVFVQPGIECKGQLFILPSAEANEVAHTVDQRRFILRKRLAEVQDLFDFCVIDTSPSGDQLHHYIYTAMDYALVPVHMEQYSFDGLVRTMAIITDENEERELNDRPPVRIAGIIPNRVKRTIEHRDNYQSLMNSPYAPHVLPALSENTRWSELTRARLSIFALDPASKSASQAWTIVHSIEEIITDVKE